MIVAPNCEPAIACSATGAAPAGEPHKRNAVAVDTGRKRTAIVVALTMDGYRLIIFISPIG